MLICFQSLFQSELKCSQSHFPAQSMLLVFFTDEVARRRKWGDEDEDCEGLWSIGEREEIMETLQFSLRPIELVVGVLFDCVLRKKSLMGLFCFEQNRVCGQDGEIKKTMVKL
ncbi:hypothetical protein Sjap_001214 [Stephania japonica]|uniref:Uncharacterized protein n=1 Tax=Stephania japonica TaxID=461633 RepID=A0AAP0KLT8_9MAGN